MPNDQLGRFSISYDDLVGFAEKVTFSDAVVAKLWRTPGEHVHVDAQQPYLFLRVSNQRGTWVFGYKDESGTLTKLLGAYPKMGTMQALASATGGYQRRAALLDRQNKGRAVVCHECRTVLRSINTERIKLPGRSAYVRLCEQCAQAARLWKSAKQPRRWKIQTL